MFNVKTFHEMFFFFKIEKKEMGGQPSSHRDVRGRDKDEERRLHVEQKEEDEHGRR